MKHFRASVIALGLLALIGGAAAPVGAVVTIRHDSSVSASAEFRGTLTALTPASIVLAVSGVSGDNLAAALRVYKDHDIAIVTDSATSVRRDDHSSSLAALRVADVLRVWARCTLVTANNTTTVSCRALRISASTPQPPRPAGLEVLGLVSARTATSLTLTPSRVESDSRGHAIEAAIKAARTLTAALDSRTVVRLSDATVSIDVVAVGSTVRAQVSCLTTAPFPCTATRLDIITPRAEKVVLVGKLASVTASAITVSVMSVVHQEDDAMDVQALHDQTLTLSVPKGTSVRKAGHGISLASLTVGTQLTVRAHCQLLTPFACVADRITAKA